MVSSLFFSSIILFALDGSKIAAKIQINPEIMPVSSYFLE
jgi:hypothetical protein